MKSRYLLAAALAVAALFVGSSPVLASGEWVKTLPASDFGTVTAVSLTTSTWTKCPAASTLGRRTGVKVRNPGSNSYSVLCTASASAPSTAITIAEFEAQPGENPYYNLGDNFNLYCLALTGAQTIDVREVRQ